MDKAEIVRSVSHALLWKTRELLDDPLTQENEDAFHKHLASVLGAGAAVSAEQVWAEISESEEYPHVVLALKLRLLKHFSNDPLAVYPSVFEVLLACNELDLADRLYLKATYEMRHHPENPKYVVSSVSNTSLALVTSETRFHLVGAFSTLTTIGWLLSLLSRHVSQEAPHIFQEMLSSIMDGAIRYNRIDVMNYLSQNTDLLEDGYEIDSYALLHEVPCRRTFLINNDTMAWLLKNRLINSEFSYIYPVICS